LLTSKHICFLSQDKWGSSKEWDAFLQEQVDNQKKWQDELGVAKEEAERAYEFMRWCDSLSLILAQQQIPDAGRSIEITSGIDGIRYDLRELPNGHLTVEPWPFEEEFTVNVETSHLSEIKYTDNESLVKALKTAPIKVLEWTFSQNCPYLDKPLADKGV
jgi:Protein of unknown function (DUF3891)